MPGTDFTLTDYPMKTAEILSGATLFVGRDSATGKLAVAVSLDGERKSALVGEDGSVPSSVSRCVAGGNAAHLSIRVDGDGALRATNLNPENVTFVDGMEIITKRVMPSDILLLGKDKFPVSVSALLSIAEKMAVASGLRKPPSKEFDITLLEAVWNNYHDRNLEIQKRARMQNVAGRVPVFFTMVSGVISSVAFTCGWGGTAKGLCIVLTVVGLAVMLYTFFKQKNDTSIEDRERLLEEFQDKYVCPNPGCGKFLGNYPYKLMKRQYSMTCPYCKCKFVEEKGETRKE